MFYELMSLPVSSRSPPIDLIWMSDVEMKQNRQPRRSAALRAMERVFVSITDPGAMSRFFDEVFTPAERRDLALRWELMRRLHRGDPQRKIAAELGISLCKITRGSRVLKEGSVSRQWLDREQRECK